MAKAAYLGVTRGRRVGLRRISAGTPEPFVAARAPYPTLVCGGCGRPRPCVGTSAGASTLGAAGVAPRPRGRVLATALPVAVVRSATGPVTALLGEAVASPSAGVAIVRAVAGTPYPRATWVFVTALASFGRLVSLVTSLGVPRVSPCMLASRCPLAVPGGTAVPVLCLAAPGSGCPLRTPSRAGRPTRLGT